MGNRERPLLFSLHDYRSPHDFFLGLCDIFVEFPNSFGCVFVSSGPTFFFNLGSCLWR